LPDELVQIAGDAFYGTISGERLDLLDTDILIWTVNPEERAVIEDNALYQQLDVAQAGRDIFLDTSGTTDLVGPALVFSSVLSLPVVFDELVPQLVAGLDSQTNLLETAPVTTTTPQASGPSSFNVLDGVEMHIVDAPWGASWEQQ